MPTVLPFSTGGSSSGSHTPMFNLAGGLSDSTMRTGVILAGGFSTRFGEADKAFAHIAVKPLIRHVADRIQPVIDGLVINARDEQVDRLTDVMMGYPLEVDYAIDAESGGGPVAGMATGLSGVTRGTTHAFVVACDMPFVDPGLVEALFDLAEADGSIEAVVPTSSDGWHQVLHGVYDPAPTVSACHRALERDQRKVLAPLSHLAVRYVEPDELEALGDERSFENVNTPGELEAAAEVLRRQDPS